MQDTVEGRPMRAALVREAAGPFLLEEVTLAPPRPTEVLVRVVASACVTLTCSSGTRAIRRRCR